MSELLSSIRGKWLVTIESEWYNYCSQTGFLKQDLLWISTHFSLFLLLLLKKKKVVHLQKSWKIAHISYVPHLYYFYGVLQPLVPNQFHWIEANSVILLYTWSITLCSKEAKSQVWNTMMSYRTHISVINKHYLKFQITQGKSEYQIHKQPYDTLNYDTAPLNHIWGIWLWANPNVSRNGNSWLIVGNKYIIRRLQKRTFHDGISELRMTRKAKGDLRFKLNPYTNTSGQILNNHALTFTVNI